MGLHSEKIGNRFNAEGSVKILPLYGSNGCLTASGHMLLLKQFTFKI